MKNIEGREGEKWRIKEERKGKRIEGRKEG